MIFKKGELFCGPGGMALGAKNARVIGKNNKLFAIEHEWANDNDYAACKTFWQNICIDRPETVLVEDVKLLPIKKLKSIDAFSFGFPCNDYSIVGKQKGLNGDYGPLYSYGVKVLNYHNPKFFVAENVGGLQSANKGYALQQILHELADAGKGYNITPHLYKFEQYGVPQRRKRIIMVGIRKDIGKIFRVPKPTHDEEFYQSARNALEDPPIPNDAWNNEPTRHHPKVVEMLKQIPPGKNAWSEDIDEHLRLNVKNARLSQIYRRLEPSKPAYTITGSGGGGTHCYHWDDPRALTNRERARIQTFPDDHIFYGLKEEVRRQIGMAVPPAAAEIIFTAILKTFAEIEYLSIEPNLIIKK